ncbi:MAG: HNH endonuclease signature motif containing protein [Propionibacteriaceae bacterium]|nr:HNH endonuclease signature motif containing protein [Propionibacteriaceae bacterium]
MEREPYTYNEIAERDGWECQLCALPVDSAFTYPNPRAGSIDHAVPLSLGGPDTRENVQLAHLACNWQKGNAAAA